MTVVLDTAPVVTADATVLDYPHVTTVWRT